MSDSEENMTPKLNDVLPELMAAKVGVSTMAMGTSADHQIEKLATMTDGKAFFFPGLQPNTEILLQIAFEESTTRGEHSVDIRDGQWTIRLESPSLQQVAVNIQVKSQAKNPNDHPIRATGKMISLKVAKPNEALILTDVCKSRKIVLDAMVVADVYGPNPPYKTTVPLHDDGRDLLQQTAPALSELHVHLDYLKDMELALSRLDDAILPLTGEDDVDREVKTAQNYSDKISYTPSRARSTGCKVVSKLPRGMLKVSDQDQATQTSRVPSMLRTM
ncbi:hypothetical protein HPB51_015502 [Rhipicephalus microplus]|uniref:Uncharacterized protein n=1 Tax=Rhipicephalus microplus TaxID=6941 RepID=A0A9J6DH50_RHIMP|nr:hypothetical protein HPB51_015502 [Rhipicephalus microplus]